MPADGDAEHQVALGHRQTGPLRGLPDGPAVEQGRSAAAGRALCSSPNAARCSWKKPALTACVTSREYSSRSWWTATTAGRTAGSAAEVT